MGAVALRQPARPAEVRLGMRPNSEQQRRFIDAGEIEQLFGGAKRGGKTVAGSIKATLLSALFPGNRGLIARRNFPDLRDSTMATFLRVCPPEMILDHAKGEKRLLLRTAGGVPSEILYRGLGDSSDFEKVKGLDLGWFWIDEPSEVPEEVFLMLRAQLNWVLPDGTRPRYMAMLTSNPEPGWVKRRYIDRMIPGGVYIRALPADNPDLPTGWERGLRDTMPAEFVQKYLDGSWNVGENSVFTELDEARHAIAGIDPSGMRIVAAVDHATTGWTAALILGIDQDENAFALEEYYQRDRLVSEHAREILQLLALYPRAEYTLIDPSTEARTLQGPHELYSVLDEYARNGLRATPAHRASIDIGINLIREYLHPSPLHRHPMRPAELGSPRLFVVKQRCPNLWQEMSELRREVKDTGRIEYKGRDHATDCLRYLLMSRPRAAARQAIDVRRLPPQERHAVESHARWAREFDDAGRGSASWF